MKRKKYILNGIVLFLLIGGTMYFVLKDQEVSKILDYIGEAKKIWLLLGGVLIFTFITLESLIIHYLLNSLSCVVSRIKCLKYSFVGFFVSLITPSASGGQPAQMYYMKGDGIGIAMSSLVLMIVTIAYKAVLIIMAAFLLLFDRSFLLTYISGIEFVMIFGIISNIIVVSLLVIVIFQQNYIENIVGKFIIWLGKHGVIKNKEALLKRILNAIKRYDSSTRYLREHRRIIFNVFVVTMLQRICYFAVTWCVYKSFGLTGCSAFEIIVLQWIISLAVDNLPLPGGLGVSEGIFMLFFKKIFTPQYLAAGLLLTRGLNYYLIIVVGGLVTLYAQITRDKDKE